LGVPYFSEHIRSLTTRFDSKLSDVGNPVVGQIGRYLRWPRADLRHPYGKSGHRGCPSSVREHSDPCQLALFRLPWLRFSVLFLSCKANARV
jgi:hypothetical protein